MGFSLVLLFLLSFNLQVQAQMNDLLGDLAIQGQIAAQGVSNYNIANLMSKKNNLAQEIQIQLIDLQTKKYNKNENVSRETLNSPILKKYNTIIKKDKNLFYFELHNVEENLCKSLINGFAGSYKIDNKNCNNLKIYYK